MDEHREVPVTEGAGRPGTRLPGLTVFPDEGLPGVYASASGDFNPIHLDDDFATSVGLPGRIIHGLWTMAQVARMLTDTAGGPERLHCLAVEFRDVGLPGQPISITGTVESVADGVATVSVAAEQSGRAVIRNASAQVQL